MTESTTTARETNTSVTDKLVNAYNNKTGVILDLDNCGKFVRETLFYAIIHDTKGDEGSSADIMGVKGKACAMYVYVFMKDPKKILNNELLNAEEFERKEYLKWIWKEGLQRKGKGNIRRELSCEKSAVYSMIAETFKSTYICQGNILKQCRLTTSPQI